MIISGKIERNGTGRWLGKVVTRTFGRMNDRRNAEVSCRRNNDLNAEYKLQVRTLRFAVLLSTLNGQTLWANQHLPKLVNVVPDWLNHGSVGVEMQVHGPTRELDFHCGPIYSVIFELPIGGSDILRPGNGASSLDQSAIGTSRLSLAWRFYFSPTSPPTHALKPTSNPTRGHYRLELPPPISWPNL